MKLFAKQIVYVVPMSIFLKLSQTFATLTKVTDKSNLHKGGTINVKQPINEECLIQMSYSSIYSGC